MFYLIERIFSPEGQQLDSDSIAEFNSFQDASAEAERRTIAQEKCPPNDDENRCEWFVIAD